MDMRRVEELKKTLQSRSTPELLRIWKSNDREMYIEEAFEAVKLILKERGTVLPGHSADIAELSHLDMAYKYWQEKDFKKALRECDSAISAEQSPADAHNLRGIILVGLGRPAEAVRAYKKALEIEPGFKEARENLDNLESVLKDVNNLTTVASFNFPSEAYIARMALEAEGIWSFLADEETLYTATHLSIAVGGVKLRVRPEDAEKALDIVNRVTGREKE